MRTALFSSPLLLSLTGLLFVTPAPAQRADNLRPTVFAIRDAKVVTEPGKVLPRATVVIRDGVIEAVGADVKIPADALVTDGKGLTVYAGFLDALSTWGYDTTLRRSAGGNPAVEDLAAESLAATKPDNRKGMTPEFQVATALKDEDQTADNWRRSGFTAHLVAPDGGLLNGQSALVSLSGAPTREAVLRSPFAQHLSFRTPGGNEYPRSLMGTIAHTRQTLLDAGHNQRLWKAFEDGGRVGRRPLLDPALSELARVLNGQQPLVVEADSRDEINRALDFAREFHIKPILFGGRDAWKAVDVLQKEETPVLLRLTFAEQQRRGRRGGPGVQPPANPATNPPTNPRGNRGNPPANPPTDPPANPPAGEDDTADRDRDLPARVKEDKERQVKEEEANAGQLHRRGVKFAFTTQGIAGDRPWEKFRENLRKAIAAGLPAEAALAALTTDAAKILGVEKQLGTIAPRKAAHLVVMDGDFHESATQVRYVFADGVRFEYEPVKRTNDRRPEEKKPDEKKPDEKKPEEKKPDEKKPDEKKPEAAKGTDQASEIEADRHPKVRTGGDVLLRNATVLTVTKGTLTETDLLVRKGKIAAIGRGLKADDGTPIIDATGMFIMPGIIDTHCHFAVSGGVNEFSLSVVPEVRVRDVVDSEDVQIYRALAGGVTTARLLHGSADVIGGQDAVIKLKYGQPAGALLLADAPRGVKFALGENVKRTDGRFPNTRLGVEAVLVRSFTDAQSYQKAWRAYEKAKAEGQPALEPRRDLRLEALADVLAGNLRVHCHCYREDEILMLLRTADQFHFKVKSLQHVLEGYKVASEIAEHGASCSTFSDWWAYKLEAYDAIPFNSALLNKAGVSVCVKSDSNELMRHLYQEAAKCVKYGGMSEVEALETITLNGARQLGLEKRLGSIEVGKDADFAIFNGHPLNNYSRVEMTLVEGEIFFQRSDKLTPVLAAREGPTPPWTGTFKLPAINGKGRYAIVGATVHPVSGVPLPDAAVVVQDGRIVSILNKTDRKNAEFAPGTRVIDATGLHLYPGMIDAGTVLGLTELDSARESQDFAEGGQFQPDLRASTGINPDSELIPVTRANGVTTVVTRPTGTTVAGQGALINLAGWVPKEMTLVDPLALCVEFPVATPNIMGDPSVAMMRRAITRKQREERVHKLKELFKQAAAHDEARKQNPDLPGNPRLEALVPYVRGDKPVIIQANRKQEILDTLALADELKIRVIISGGLDAWKVTDELKKRQVAVILGPVMTLPQESYDPYDAPFACAAKLHEAGVPFCIRSAGSTNTRNLPYEAAMAASYGLPVDEALKAVTLYPAQILGVADQVGSIETGRRANLVLTNGDMLQASTQVLGVFIDGRPLEPTSKQTRLFERYLERLKEVKEGKAPLGTK
jgi:imidazolonepropionase-like amidohydrolase